MMSDFKAEHTKASILQPPLKRKWLNKTIICNIAFLLLVPGIQLLAAYLSSAVIGILGLIILPFLITFCNPVEYTKDRKCFNSYGEDITEKTSASALAWLAFFFSVLITATFKDDICLMIANLGADIFKIPVIFFFVLILPISILIVFNVPIAVWLQKDPYAPKQQHSTRNNMPDEERRKRNEYHRIGRIYSDPSYSALSCNIHHHRTHHRK